MSDLKLKVCGIKSPDDIHSLIEIRPDFIGFIFYKKSPRYAGDVDPNLVSHIPLSIKRVGVFVNAEVDEVLGAFHDYGLDYVQLHGDEDLSYCQTLKERGVRIIKVFRILDSLPYAIAEFREVADYFLFDTASSYYGGSGRHFDWSILQNYKLDTPYLLSGGIGLSDLDDVRSFKSEKMVGIDVNSKFELEPGVKDIKMVRKLKVML